jgi:hypothetical protein
VSGTGYNTTKNLGLIKPNFNQDNGAWGDHLNFNWDKIDTLLASQAPGPFMPLAGGNMAGPLALAGASTASTAPPGTNNTQIANTLFVNAAIAAAFSTLPGAPVISVAGRTGAVILAHKDITDWDAAVLATVGTIPSSPVLSVAGRTGVVVLAHTDITDWNTTLAPYALKTDLSGFAPINNPTFTGIVTLPQPGGLKGTGSANNASAGSVGEYISGVLSPASEVALSNGVSSNLVSIALPAGDWDVRGSVTFQTDSSTITSLVVAGISASGSMPGIGGGPVNGARTDIWTVQLTGETLWNIPVLSSRFSLASATTVFLIAQSEFGSGTSRASGWIAARRER